MLSPRKAHIIDSSLTSNALMPTLYSNYCMSLSDSLGLWQHHWVIQKELKKDFYRSKDYK